MSLRTKDPTVAKERFTVAYGALARQLDGLRSGPKTLTHKELVALAGEAYRDRVAGRSSAWIAVDIFRIEDALLTEHWDVLQDQATRATSVSGLPMFGTDYPA